MERAGQFLGSVLRRLRDANAAIAWLRSVWPQVVGKTLAAHIDPITCENGRLEVAADSEEWARQIRSMERELCAQINCAWGGDLVRDIRLVQSDHELGVTPPKRHFPHEFDNQHVPFIRRRHS